MGMAPLCDLGFHPVVAVEEWPKVAGSAQRELSSMQRSRALLRVQLRVAGVLQMGRS